MKRFVILVLLLALPIRTVLAVSGLACGMMPMQQPPSNGVNAPCAMHFLEGAGTNLHSEVPAGAAVVACPSCAAACCATLAPVPPSISGIAPAPDDLSAFSEAAFDSTVRRSLERPPKHF